MEGRTQEVLLPVYARYNLFFTDGNGAYLMDQGGHRYLDFASGVGVSIMGHKHPKVQEALEAAIKRPLHVSNAFRIQEAESLATKLTRYTGFDSVFFCNAGTEAIETCLKIGLRRHAQTQVGKRLKSRIVTFHGSFHGRSLGADSVSDNGANFLSAEVVTILPSVDEIQKTIDETVAMVLVEPIQGRAGIYPMALDVLRVLQDLCLRKGVLLCFDCIQSGYGRTGYFLACQKFGIQPDLCAVGKGMAGGLPMAACLVSKELRHVLPLGGHGSTFGGNPFVCAVADAVFGCVTQESFLQRIAVVATYLWEKLWQLKRAYPSIIHEIRGRGLMIGVALHEPHVASEVSLALVSQHKLLVVATPNNTLRLLPPLIISESHVDECIRKLEDCLGAQKT